MDENVAALDRFVGPQTPPNRPWFLTEDGLLMTLPVYDDSPLDSLDQDRSEPTSDQLEKCSRFGDWLPGHEPWVNSPSVLGPRHERREASPSDRIIWRRRRGTLAEETGFGNRLLRLPRVGNTLSLVSGHNDQGNDRMMSMMEWDWPTGSLESRDVRPSKTQRSERVGDGTVESRWPTRPWEL